MKVYLLNDSDFDRLLAELDRDPRWGTRGGSSVIFSDVEQKAHEEAHSRFNYRVRTWLDSVRRGNTSTQ